MVIVRKAGTIQRLWQVHTGRWWGGVWEGSGGGGSGVIKEMGQAGSGKGNPVTCCSLGTHQENKVVVRYRQVTVGVNNNCNACFSSNNACLFVVCLFRNCKGNWVGNQEQQRRLHTVFCPPTSPWLCLSEPTRTQLVEVGVRTKGAGWAKCPVLVVMPGVIRR